MKHGEPMAKVGTAVVTWVDKWHQHVKIPSCDPELVFQALVLYNLVKNDDRVICSITRDDETHILLRRNVSRKIIVEGSKS